jgi:hypothetical protein
MGTDNLHHRRKIKSRNDFLRGKENKSQKEKILIVCEGEKTEINYFEELKSKLRLSALQVSVHQSPRNCPLVLATYAEEKSRKNEFDKIYCVFDKDTHTNFENAKNKISSLGDKFKAAYSVPCFEYWLVLHFMYTNKPFNATNKKSIGDQVCFELKKYLPNYKKNQKNILELIGKINKSEIPSILKNAIDNAKKANQETEKNKTDNPSTFVGELVDYLMQY